MDRFAATENDKFSSANAATVVTPFIHKAAGSIDKIPHSYHKYALTIQQPVLFVSSTRLDVKFTRATLNFKSCVEPENRRGGTQLNNDMQHYHSVSVNKKNHKTSCRQRCILGNLHLGRADGSSEI